MHVLKIAILKGVLRKHDFENRNYVSVKTYKKVMFLSIKRFDNFNLNLMFRVHMSKKTLLYF